LSGVWMLLIRSAADSWDSTVTLHSVFNDSLTCISKVNVSSIYLCRQVTRHEQLSMFMVTFAAMSYNTSYAPNIGDTFSKKTCRPTRNVYQKIKKKEKCVKFTVLDMAKLYGLFRRGPFWHRAALVWTQWKSLQ